MNFIGKIFVVFIFIMSIVFMTLSAVVYSTHQNWKEKEQQAQQALTEARTDASRKETEFNRMKSELDAQRQASLQQIGKLETERDRLTDLSSNLQRQVDELSTQVTEATAMVAATQKSNNLTTEENQQLRSDIR
ncbi:MAG: hypothetical protein KDA37_08785, partial [Planctomycetales bacterium]|nr:hypothetical protein [Planctomycetales bacterium]